MGYVFVICFLPLNQVAGPNKGEKGCQIRIAGDTGPGETKKLAN